MFKILGFVGVALTVVASVLADTGIPGAVELAGVALFCISSAVVRFA